jgi:hypothetical protein
MRKGTLFILLGATAFVAVVFVLLAHVQPIKVIDSRLEHEGDNVFVAGDLRNTSARPATLDLEIHYYDNAGRPLGEDRLQVGPAQRRRRAAFSRPRTHRRLGRGFLTPSQPGAQSVRQLTGTLLPGAAATKDRP